MKFTLQQAYEILERTPAVLRAQLLGLDAGWLMNNEGPDTFSPFDVVGHLLHGEKTDWATRAKMILEHEGSPAFAAWNRFAMYEESRGKTMEQLLDELAAVRKQNIAWLQSAGITEAGLDKKGLHPVLGPVTLRHLLATWVVHDLTHIAQINRVMARQYKEEIGPWTDFFRILSF